jgi:hypothetical protein
MTTKNYLILLVVVAVVTPLALMLLPGLANTVESLLLLFLASTAS